MFRYLTLTLATLCFTWAPTPADAAKGFGLFRDLTFVAETRIPGFFLCHETEHFGYRGLPLTTESIGYALAGERCESEIYDPLTVEDVREGIALGLLPADLLVEPALTPMQKGLNIALIAAAVLGFLGFTAHQAGLFRRQSRAIENSRTLSMGLSGMGKGGKKITRKTALRMLAAMCCVARSDGEIHPEEITEIITTIRRLSGIKIAHHQVLAMLEDLERNEAEVAELVMSAGPKERLPVFEAALSVAIADGKMAPAEYDVLQELSDVLNIGATQFRTSLANIAGPLMAKA